MKEYRNRRVEKRMKQVKRMNQTWLCFFGMIAILMGILGVSYKVEAATPRLMVSDYSVPGGSVVGGKEFDLKVSLTNTAAKSSVKNIKVTLVTENGEMLPVDSAGTAYIESVDANSTEDLTFKMKAVKGLEEKSYKMTIKMEYESSNGMEYTVEDHIFLPVTMEQRLMLTDIYVAGSDVHIGDEVEVTAKINNLGEGKLYNVTVELHGDGIDTMQSYVGNIDPGKSGNVDIITIASEVTYVHSKNYLKLTYEDIDGNKQEEEYELVSGALSVSSPVYDDLELVKGEKETKKDWTVVKWVIVVTIIVVIVAVVIIRRAKRKKKILEEF